MSSVWAFICCAISAHFAVICALVAILLSFRVVALEGSGAKDLDGLTLCLDRHLAQAV
jgi:hypothetical protein